MKKIILAILLLAIVFAAGCFHEKKPDIVISEPGQPKPETQPTSPGTDQPSEPAKPEEKPTEPPSQPQKSPEELCQSEPSEFKIDQCLKSAAASQNKPTICESLKVIPSDVCYKEAAIANKNLEACKKIGLASERNSCLKSVAIALNDYKLCLQINASKADEIAVQDSCLTEFSQKMNSIEPCLYVSGSLREGEIARDSCLWPILQSKKDISLCQNLISESLKSDCISQFVTTALDTSKCEPLHTADERDNCIKSVAVTAKQYETCNEILSKEIKEGCFESLIDIAPSSKLCALISDTTEKNRCYSKVSLLENDATLCKGIEGTKDLEDQCFYAYATQKDSIDTCTMIATQVNNNMKDKCYNFFAIKKKDPAICEHIFTISTYVNCFQSIADSLDDYSVCTAIKKTLISSYSKHPIDSLCIKNFAISSEQPFLCDYIKQTVVKEACIDGNSAFK